MSKSSFKKALPILCGNTLEAYDFFLYGLLTPIFAKIFFPVNFQHSLIATFTIFALAYISRPMGAVFWGYIGDKYGRKTVLIGTLSIMAVPAIGMSITPTYESVGVISCVIIIILRLIQGFSFGGEHTTVIVTTYELAPKNRKGLIGCLADCFGIFGFIIGLSLTFLLKNTFSEPFFQNYGWRFLFMISMVFITIVAYVRLHTPETKPESVKKVQLTLKNYFVDFTIIFLYLITAHTIFGDLFFYNHIYIFQNNSIIQSVDLVQLVTMIFSPLIIIFCGWISDKINKVKFVRYGHISLIFSSILLYEMMTSNLIFWIILGYILFQIITCFLIATFPPLIVNQASKNHRVLIVSISYSLAIILGSFVPAINELLIKGTHMLSSPAYLVMLFSVISFLTTFFMKPLRC